MADLIIKITTQEKNKMREKIMNIHTIGEQDRYLNYPMLKLKRTYVDLQIRIDNNGRLKGIHLKEEDRVIL